MGFNSNTINFKAGLDTSRIATGVQKIQGHFSKLEQNVSKLSTVMNRVFIAGAVIGVAKSAIGFAELGGQVDGVRSAFNKLSKSGDLEKLREATRGMVSDLELMRQANFARSVGIEMDQLAQAMAYAQRYAAATGKAMEEIMSDATLEMIRQTGLRLDNIGLNIDKVKTKAKQMGFIPAMLSEMAENSKKFSSETLTTSERIAQMRIKVENVKNILASGFSKTIVSVAILLVHMKDVFVSVFQTIAVQAEHTFKKMFKSLFDVGLKLSTMVGPAGALGRALVGTFASFAGYQDDAIKDLPKIRDLAEVWKDLAAVWSGAGVSGFETPPTPDGETIDTLKKAKEEAKKFHESLEFKSVVDYREAIANALNPPKSDLKERMAGINEEMRELAQNLPQIDQMWDDTITSMQAKWEQFAQNFKDMIDGFITESIYEFANTLGRALGGAEGAFDNFGQKMLHSFGQFLEQMGKMFIAFGVAKLALSNALQPQNIANPASAVQLIAAGAAMAAIGGVITASMSKFQETGSTSNPGVPSQSFNDGYNFQSRIDGYDIVIVTDRNQRLRNRRG